MIYYHFIYTKSEWLSPTTKNKNVCQLIACAIKDPFVHSVQYIKIILLWCAMATQTSSTIINVAKAFMNKRVGFYVCSIREWYQHIVIKEAANCEGVLLPAITPKLFLFVRWGWFVCTYLSNTLRIGHLQLPNEFKRLHLLH